MRKIFFWFYSLPIADAVMLILLVTVGFRALRERYRRTSCWRAGTWLLFLAWIMVILLGTLIQRTQDKTFLEPVMVPFQSYVLALRGGNREIYRTNFMNMVLFYPAGLLGCEVLPKHWKKGWKILPVTVFFALASMGIEYTQYRFGMGLAEVDDIIHNTLGTFLGAIAWGISLPAKWKHK